MYKFAYFYVKAGYIAGLVIGLLTVSAFTFLIIKIQIDKPSRDSSNYNLRLSQIQDRIKSQVEAIEKTFNLNDSVSLASLKNQSWNSDKLSQNSVIKLFEEHKKSQNYLEEIKKEILLSFTKNVLFVNKKLDNYLDSKKLNQKNDRPPNSDILNKRFLLIYNNNDIQKKLEICSNVNLTLSEILSESESEENKNAISIAIQQTENFQRIFNEQNVNKPSRDNQILSIAVSNQSATPSIKRVEDIARLLDKSIIEMEFAVTDGLILSSEVYKIFTEIDGFRDEVNKIETVYSSLFEKQIICLALLLICLIASFFIAVGSDFIKAILDSAVWLSHIYENTSIPKRTDATDGEC
jgi:hypothetical protein